MDRATRSVWKCGRPKGQPDLTWWGRHPLTQCLAIVIPVQSFLVVPSQTRGCLCSPRNRKPLLWVMQQWVKPSAPIWDLFVEGSPCRGTAPLHPASELLGDGILWQRWLRGECHRRKLLDYDMLLPISFFFSFIWSQWEPIVSQTLRYMAMPGYCGTIEDNSAPAEDMEWALGFTELDELCCQKQCTCKNPDGVRNCAIFNISN